MKTEKIYSPSELKDGDNIKFTYTYNNVVTKVVGEVYFYMGLRVTLSNIEYLMSDRKNTYFNPEFSDVERIIKEGGKRTQNHMLDSSLYLLSSFNDIPIKPESEFIRMCCNFAESMPLPTYKRTNRFEIIQKKELELAKENLSKLQRAFEAMTPPPKSTRIETYDLISKESLDTIDEAIEKLEYVVELTEKLKKLGVKIKMK